MRAWFGRCESRGGRGSRRCVALVADVRVANVGVSDDLVDNLAGRLVRHAVGRREDDVRPISVPVHVPPHSRECPDFESERRRAARKVPEEAAPARRRRCRSRPPRCRPPQPRRSAALFLRLPGSASSQSVPPFACLPTPPPARPTGAAGYRVPSAWPRAAWAVGRRVRREGDDARQECNQREDTHFRHDRALMPQRRRARGAGSRDHLR